MAAFGGHVVRHVLCRRDKVREVFVAFGLNAKTTTKNNMPGNGCVL